jgi:heat shock protein HslJ
MMNRALSCLLLSIACVVSVGACAAGGSVSQPDGSTATAKLAGTSWTVEDVSGQAVIDKTQTAMRFEADGRVSGSTVSPANPVGDHR